MQKKLDIKTLDKLMGSTFSAIKLICRPLVITEKVVNLETLRIAFCLLPKSKKIYHKKIYFVPVLIASTRRRACG